MAGRSRSKLNGWQKLLLAALCAVVLWQVLLTDVVSNAVLGFLLGGEVPGTSIIVSPDAMLWGVAAIVVLGVVTLAIRMVVGGRRARRLARAEVETAEEVSAEETFAEEPAIELEPVVLEAEAMTAEFVVATEPEVEESKKPSVVPPLTTLRRKYFAYYWQVRSQLKPLRKRSARVFDAFGRAAHKAVVYIVGTYELVRIEVIKFGVWLRPHLVRVVHDIRLAAIEVARQIGVTLRQLKRWLASRLGRLEHVEILKEVKVAAKSTLQETKQTAVKAVAKQKAKRTPKPAKKTKPKTVKAKKSAGPEVTEE